MGDLIIEGLRSLLWGLTSALLWMMDEAYKIVLKVATLNFADTDILWKYWVQIMAFLGFFIVMRFASIFIRSMMNDEFRDKINGIDLFKKLLLIGLCMGGSPIAIKYVASAGVIAVENIAIFTGTTTDMVPSSLILTSYLNMDKGSFDENGNWIENNPISYKLDDIDINEDDPSGKKDYKFFPDLKDVFVIAILGIASAILLLMNSIQIAKRAFSLALKTLIAPIPISSLINPSDDSFGTWVKMIIADVITNFVQVLFLLFVLVAISSSYVKHLGTWIQLISLIAGLLILVSGIPEITRLIGGDTSTGGILQQLSQFRMATRGMGSSLFKSGGAVLGFGAGVAATAGAGAVYGAGRMMGGKSMSSAGGNSTGSTQGFKSGEARKPNSSNVKTSSSPNNSNSSNGMRGGNMGGMPNTPGNGDIGSFGGKPSNGDARAFNASGFSEDNSRASSGESGTFSASGFSEDNRRASSGESGTFSASGFSEDNRRASSGESGTFSASGFNEDNGRTSGGESGQNLYEGGRFNETTNSGTFQNNGKTNDINNHIDTSNNDSFS
ncbi:MAG: hypothetical protein RR443_12775, partial [Anaerorhabdus sp.]|uniref:hypothetical protein n=1 Tax=Anaerorhabdus sp. TaxID=1872524 RepID=UPI002FCC3EAD